MIHLELIIGELTSNTLFNVIDAKTSYNVLLGQPWLYENVIIPSTFHQCFKFYRKGIKKVKVNAKSFIKVESYFANTKFYTENKVIQEVLLLTILSIGKDKLKKEKVEHFEPTIVG